jgi:hypothetical protein
VRRRWAKGLLIAHLGITSLAVIVTGNHRFLDFAGSVAEVALAYGAAGAIAWAFARRRARHRARALEQSAPVPVTT